MDSPFSIKRMYDKEKSSENMGNFLWTFPKT